MNGFFEGLQSGMGQYRPEFTPYEFGKKEIKMNKQKHIDEIMDWFDFGRVAKAMEALDWAWVLVGVPTESEIRVEVRKNLNEAIDIAIRRESKCMVSTGGFHYEVDPKLDYVSLKFVVSDWMTNGY